MQRRGEMRPNRWRRSECRKDAQPDTHSTQALCRGAAAAAAAVGLFLFRGYLFVNLFVDGRFQVSEGKMLKVVVSPSPCFRGDFPESVTDDRYMTSE